MSELHHKDEPKHKGGISLSPQHGEHSKGGPSSGKGDTADIELKSLSMGSAPELDMKNDVSPVTFTGDSEVQHGKHKGGESLKVHSPDVLRAQIIVRDACKKQTTAYYVKHAEPDSSAPAHREGARIKFGDLRLAIHALKPSFWVRFA